ncbi:MAG: glycoside hydrolase family 3 C-terminal domain-containing protein [Clostridia bacterium]|nr:glycoside hydrolase family 3 C-terminal domain-containing protein [Clostridia bacterium]
MKEKHYSKKSYFALHTCVLALLLAICIAAQVITAKWDSVLTDFFGTVGGTQTSVQAGDFVSEYDSEEALRAAQLDHTRRVVAEGVVLMKNEDSFLPLKSGAQVSVFGLSSASGKTSGSGSGDIEIDSDTLGGALQKAGFGVNAELTKFTGSTSHVHGTGAGPGAGDAMGEWKIDEIPWSEYTDAVKASFSSYADAAIVVITRQNGEGSDLPREMGRFGNNPEKHYLQLSDEEQALLLGIRESGAFAGTILVINAANPIQLPEIDQAEYGVKSVMWYAGTGTDGIASVADIFAGLISPSGRLVDTWAYDNLSAPAMQNFGDFRFLNADGTETGNAYMNYGEGIYVGYRYYETRYEDRVLGMENVGDYDYASTVQFPFGFGLSYTSFDWSGFSVKLDGDTVTAAVTVKNTGSMAGKDVVEIYAQAPYTAGGVEKSAVVLAGYAKTKELKAGESEKVTVSFDLKDIASYDFATNKTWILDAGTYYVTAGRDAHDAVNNVLAAKGRTAADGMTEEGSAAMAGTFEVSAVRLLDTSVTGAKVINQFDSDVLPDAAYLSRSNWAMMDNGGLRYSTEERAGISKNTDAAGTAGTAIISDEVAAGFARKGADSVDLAALAAQDFPSKEDYIYGAEVEEPLTLVSMRGKAYDDPQWEELINQTKLSEQHSLFNNSGYGTKAIEAIQKPKTFEYDGPAGISNFITGKSGFGYARTITLAATWNQELAAEFGKLIGEDAILTRTAGWYAPATNIHRTPFSGRNFEYFSEDPLQSGVITAAVIREAQAKGCYVYMKHFALNDQETNRSAYHQVAVFSQEQAIREIYLKPFQMGVEDGDAHGIMLAMNRIGTTWTGDHYNLLTNVTRGEWGFSGIFITDYLGSMDVEMIDKYLAAGGDLILSTSELKLSDVKQNWCRAYLRDSMHRVLYQQANSLAVNGLGGEDVKFEVGTPIYKIALWTLSGLLAVYLIYSVIRMIQYGRMTEQQFADSRERTKKARRIKNIVLVVILLALVVVFFVVYFPLLQKAFLI